MNAISPPPENPSPPENSSCSDASTRETEHVTRSSVRPDLDTAPVTGIPEIGAEISKTGWGGARANAGGARPDAGRKPSVRAIQSRPTGPRWFVASIAASEADAIVRAILEGEDRRGYAYRPPLDVHHPTTAVERRIRGEHQVVHRPMFPGYLFVRFDPQQDPWGAIRTVDGVRDIISTRGGLPIPLPASRPATDAEPARLGFVEWLIETAPERLKLAEARMPCFAPGQMLRVEDGPFSNFPATCVSCDGRMTVALVHIFGRDTRVEMARRMFSAA